MYTNTLKKDRMTVLLEKLVRAPSCETLAQSTCPTCGNVKENMEIDESRVAEIILEELERHSFDVTRQRVEGQRYNIVASLGDPRLILAGHMDTVTPGDVKKWIVTPPWEPKVEGDRLYGLGAVDMKGGIAAILAAAEETSKENVDGLWLLFDVDEEYSFKGMEKFVNEYTISPELTVFAEPTDLKIMLAHRGCYEIHITVSGRGAHAGEPEKGVDAATLYKILLELREEISSDRFFHNILGKPSLNVGYFQAGTCEKNRITSRPNRVPDIAFAAIDIRPTPTLELQWLVNKLKDKIAEHGLELKKEIETTIKYKPLLPPETRFEILEDAIKNVGITPKYDVMIGYSEAGILHDRFNIPCANFGPGPESSAHTCNEYVHINDLMKCKEVYKHLIHRLCVS
jgi:acetylornithine deacetylase/succinyl-diaminopimelate desuccinylase-like protein